MNRNCLTALVVAPLVAAAVHALPAGASAAALLADCTTTTVSFDFTGAPQDYVVPEGVTSISIDVFGAQGGSLQNGLHAAGGRATGSAVAVVPGETLQVVVGGRGSDAGAGGFNGGGSITQIGGGGGGGGGTDVRRGPYALTDRLVVAGGGGGGRGMLVGGAGGGLSGLPGIQSGGGLVVADGGTQLAGGVGAHHTGTVGGDGQPGSLGLGGDGPVVPGAGSGGGGGYYGGGGGGWAVSALASAGGGSGFGPAGTTFETGTHTGDGRAEIVACVPAPPTTTTEPPTTTTEPPTTTTEPPATTTEPPATTALPTTTMPAAPVPTTTTTTSATTTPLAAPPAPTSTVDLSTRLPDTGSRRVPAWPALALLALGVVAVLASRRSKPHPG